MQACAANDAQAFAGLDQRAAQVSNYGLRCSWVGFTVPGIGNAQHISRKLQHRVLASPACAEIRTAILAGEANGTQRTIHRAVRAGRNAPETGVALQISRQRCFGGKPFRMNARAVGCKAKCDRNGLVGGDGRVVITDESDAPLLSPFALLSDDETARSRQHHDGD